MKLSYKLFISYLIVVMIALAVLAIATAFVAPVNFSQQMSHMRGNGSGMMSQRMTTLDADLEANFRDAVYNALLIAAGVAVIAALAISWFVAQRIVSPIRSLVTLSQRIADGDYDQRLRINSGDEFAELVESFNRMTESLANTESMRVHLLGDVTHELKTPLASIKGYMEGLQDGVLPATPDTFQLIHREADRLQRLVQDLQELSRAESGQIPLTLEAHDLNHIVRPMVERMRPQFNEKEIALVMQIPADIPLIRCDLDRTAQIITNLLGNALQYTSSGGEVRISAAHDSLHATISVSDTGIGISPEDLPLIFQRFYRVDKSRSRASGGSGIGLTVSKHLVEAQGGEIHAESAGPGQGSQFVFTLPLA